MDWHKGIGMLALASLVATTAWAGTLFKYDAGAAPDTNWHEDRNWHLDQSFPGEMTCEDMALITSLGGQGKVLFTEDSDDKTFGFRRICALRLDALEEPVHLSVEGGALLVGDTVIRNGEAGRNATLEVAGGKFSTEQLTLDGNQGDAEVHIDNRVDVAVSSGTRIQGQKVRFFVGAGATFNTGELNIVGGEGLDTVVIKEGPGLLHSS